MVRCQLANSVNAKIELRAVSVTTASHYSGIFKNTIRADVKVRYWPNPLTKLTIHINTQEQYKTALTPGFQALIGGSLGHTPDYNAWHRLSGWFLIETHTLTSSKTRKSERIFLIVIGVLSGKIASISSWVLSNRIKLSFLCNRM